jgi:hypothetical protein
LESVRTVGLTALVLGLIDDLGDGTFDGTVFADQFISRGIVRGGRSVGTFSAQSAQASTERRVRGFPQTTSGEVSATAVPRAVTYERSFR